MITTEDWYDFIIVFFDQDRAWIKHVVDNWNYITVSPGCDCRLNQRCNKWNEMVNSMVEEVEVNLEDAVIRITDDDPDNPKILYETTKDFHPVLAPWSDEVINSLNAFQIYGTMHEYTCKNGHGLLVATTNGWACSKCDYTQDWAHSWTADWSWREPVNES
jgi:hypothetical protein